MQKVPSNCGLQRYVGLSEMAEALSVFIKTLDRMVADGKFPRSVRQSPNRVGWAVETVRGHLQSRIEGVTRLAVSDPDKLAPEDIEPTMRELGRPARGRAHRRGRVARPDPARHRPSGAGLRYLVEPGRTAATARGVVRAFPLRPRHRHCRQPVPGHPRVARQRLRSQVGARPRPASPLRRRLPRRRGLGRVRGCSGSNAEWDGGGGMRGSHKRLGVGGICRIARASLPEHARCLRCLANSPPDSNETASGEPGAVQVLPRAAVHVDVNPSADTGM